MVEIPLLKTKYEEHLVEDRKFWEQQEEERVSGNRLLKLVYFLSKLYGIMCLKVLRLIAQVRRLNPQMVNARGASM